MEEVKRFYTLITGGKERVPARGRRQHTAVLEGKSRVWILAWLNKVHALELVHRLHEPPRMSVLSTASRFNQCPASQ